MRPTDLRFILPTEKTGEYLYPKIMYDGCKLGFEYSLRRRSVCSRKKSRNKLMGINNSSNFIATKYNYLNQSCGDTHCTFSGEKRFIEYDRIKYGYKGTSENVGPGSYATLDVNKKRVRGSVTYRKFLSIEDPKTQNQYAYYDHRLMKTLEKPKSRKVKRIKINSKVDLKRRLEIDRHSDIVLSMNKSCASNEDVSKAKHGDSSQYSKMRTSSTFGGAYSKRNSISSSVTKRSKVKSKMFELDSKTPTNNINNAGKKLEIEEAKISSENIPKTAPKQTKRRKLDKSRKESIIERYSRMMNSNANSEFIRRSANKNRTYF